jgi:hypothetical protein
MADEPHEVVKLLLARIESHPEEFEGGMSSRHTRWRKALEDVFSNLTDEEAKPLQSALNKVRLDEIHKSVMDELLNGDERRRMEEAEYEAELIRKATILKANNQIYPNAQAVGLAPGQYSQAVHDEMLRINSHGSMGIGSVTPYTQLGSGITGKSASMAVLDEMLSMTPKPSLLQRSKSFFRK